MRAAAGALVLAASAGAASAQPAAPVDLPAGGLVDRTGAASAAGLDVGYVMWDDDSFGAADITAIRLDLHGHWVSPAGGGAYGVLPMAYGHYDLGDLGIEESDASLGNAELGGLFVLPGAPGATAVLRAGVTVPTAPNPSASLTELDGFGPSLAAFARPADLVHAIAEASYVRLAASPLYRSGQLVARVDLGLDVPIYSGTDDDLPTIGRLNAAVGADTGQIAFLGELVNLFDLEDEEQDGDRVLHFIGATIRYTGGPVQPALSVVVPLDDEVSEQVDLAVLLGVTALLPSM